MKMKAVFANYKFVKDLFAKVGVIALFVSTFAFAAFAQGDNKPKHADYIEVFGKILSIDPIKGDVSVRLEFLPHGNFMKEDGTMSRTVKFDISR